MVRQEPRPSAALLQGLFFSHIAPYSAQRRELTMPALVIGHHIDPVHPFSDAGVLTSELPNARLVEASNILELRFRPERLTAEIAGFVAEMLVAAGGGKAPPPAPSHRLTIGWCPRCPRPLPHAPVS